MINAENISFPITLEVFAEFQRASRGRGFTAKEMECFSDVVEVANEAYSAAARGDVDAVQSILNAINTAPTDSPFSRHIAAVFRGWVYLACQRGAEQLKAAIDGNFCS